MSQKLRDTSRDVGRDASGAQMRRGVDAECGCAEAEAWGGGRAVATVLVVLGVQAAARRAAGGAADR